MASMLRTLKGANGSCRISVTPCRPVVVAIPSNSARAGTAGSGSTEPGAVPGGAETGGRASTDGPAISGAANPRIPSNHAVQCRFTTFLYQNSKRRGMGFIALAEIVRDYPLRPLKRPAKQSLTIGEFAASKGFALLGNTECLLEADASLPTLVRFIRHQRQTPSSEP